MERDHRIKSSFVRVLTLGFVSLEIAAQILSLSLFPASGSIRGPSPSAPHSPSTVRTISFGSLSHLVMVLLDPHFAGFQPERAGREDEGRKLLNWPRVDVVVREKSGSASSIVLLPPSGTALSVDWARPRVSPTTPRDIGLSTLFCRLTC